MRMSGHNCGRTYAFIGEVPAACDSDVVSERADWNREGGAYGHHRGVACKVPKVPSFHSPVADALALLGALTNW